MLEGCLLACLLLVPSIVFYTNDVARTFGYGLS